MIRLLALTAILSTLAGCQPGGSSPDAYPSRPITYLVPWNPGGGTDTVSRALAAVLQNSLDTPVNVVNRTGGGGVVGHLAISQARPDGYTVGAVTVEITMMHWAGLTELTHRDFTPIALLMDNPAALTVRADAPWDTVEELLEAIRANPGGMFASGTSKGGIWDLARMGFLKAAGLPESALPWVPSQGAAPALQELLAGGVQVVTIALAETEALYRAGQVKVLAVMAEERLEAFPEVPTLKERGIDWSLGGWVSIGAPADLPPDVVTQLRQAIAVTVQDPLYAEPLKRAGFNLRFLTGEAFDAFLAEQDRINGELLGASGGVMP
ncbi:MAG: tripartite tricarboxylate transporter substrate binding protein [Rhodothermales bacterium]|nr:tripartite tricarboxylate transporter substrate binding protein [Rhodothermales bacterium]